jgi:hypothetical protein
MLETLPGKRRTSMPRSVQITVPPQQTDALVDEIKALEGLIGLRVQRGISIQPPGDIITLEITTAALHNLMRLLDRFGVGADASSSAVTSHPQSIVSAAHARVISQDSSEATWEEMELTIGHESNMTVNGLLLMAIAGIVAAIGISTDTLHLVIGAMVIAPGFEPISRIALGVVAQGEGWRRGLVDTAKAYVVLVISAGVTALLLQAMGIAPLGGNATYLAEGSLVSYWTNITGNAIAASAAAAIAGALLLSANRSVLTAGVMIALALIPTAALAGMALVAGDLNLVGQALLRWAIDLALVALLSLVVFQWKRAALQQRNTRV